MRGLRNNESRVPGLQSRVVSTGREDGLPKLLDELTVINLDRVDGQRGWEFWELKHLDQIRSSSQCWQTKRKRNAGRDER